MLTELTNTGTFASHLLYVNSTEFGIVNDDGSKTYVTGTNIVYDPVSGRITSGILTGIKHYSPTGTFMDSMSGFSLDASRILNLLDFFGSPSFTASLFSGDDVIELRYRAGGAVVSDRFDGNLGNDLIMSGSGNDTIQGNSGNDTVWGGADNDVLLGDAAPNQLGQDRLHGEGGTDILFGSGGNDHLGGGAGTDTAVYFGTFADLKITRTSAGFSVTSQHGTDTFVGVERIAVDDGTFQFNGTTGTWSRINSQSGTALMDPGKALNGTAGADNLIIFNVNPPNVISALGGNDTIAMTGISYAQVSGGDGNDSITANGTGFDMRLYGDAGNDTIDMGTSLALIADRLYGGAGDDVLNGGTGGDVLNGGSGADIFKFDFLPGTRLFPFAFVGWGNDVIRDFQLGLDHITLSGTTGTGTTTLTQTADGLLLTFAPTSTSVLDPSTILFQGLQAPNATLQDLLV